MEKVLTERDGDIACGSRNDKARQYQRLYMACFIIFLVIIALDRILPRQWRFRQRVGPTRKSVIEDAREQAGEFMPYLFMNF